MKELSLETLRKIVESQEVLLKYFGQELSELNRNIRILDNDRKDQWEYIHALENEIMKEDS